SWPVGAARRDARGGVGLGGRHADAVGGAGGGAERAADALLEAVGMTVQPVAPAEARVDGPLVLGIGLRHRTPEEMPQRDGEALQALCLLAAEIDPGAHGVFLEIVEERHRISIRTAPPRRRCRAG